MDWNGIGNGFSSLLSQAAVQLDRNTRQGLPVTDRDILIFSNIDTEQPKRERATVWASFDGGKTWPVKRLVYDGPSAYSSLAAGRPGTPSEGLIFLHFEGGPKGGSQVARFNLAWLLEGELTRDGKIPGDLE